MRKIIFILLTISVYTSSYAQDNIDDLLAAGIDDAKRFTANYIAPASEGLAYSINNGWFNNGKSPKKYGFELSIIANVSFIKDTHKTFTMNVSDYQNIRFKDNSMSKNAATALGHNDPDITVIVTYDDPIFGDQEAELTLPTGIGSTNIDLIPTAFVQGSFSPFKGTQVKARFFPKTKTEGAEISLYGVGLQQEFTSWLSTDKILPIAIFGLVAYTHLDGSYDLTKDGIVDGENQSIHTEVNTIIAELIVSTKLNIINFYGAMGYLNGKSSTNLLGSYRVSNSFLSSEEIVDPFSIQQNVSGIRTTLGANLKLGFFGISADYTLAEFDSASLGVHFSL